MIKVSFLASCLVLASQAIYAAQITPVGPEKAPTLSPKSISIVSIQTQAKRDEATKMQAELESLRAALASTGSRLRESEADRDKIAAELRLVKKQSPVEVQQEAKVVDNEKSFAIADRGEAVFFSGVGEAKIGMEGQNSILRFSLVDADRADKVLSGKHNRRQIRGGYVYYTIDRKKLKL